jgi:hypothetical protein
VYDRQPNKRPRELPLYPAWWREHKRDAVLIAAHARFSEEGGEPSPCIWHLRADPADQRATATEAPDTKPSMCVYPCRDLSDLYGHNCPSRRAAGGDVHMMHLHLGNKMDVGHIKRSVLRSARAAGLKEAPVVSIIREGTMWRFWGPDIIFTAGEGGGAADRDEVDSDGDENVTIADGHLDSDIDDEEEQKSPAPAPKKVRKHPDSSLQTSSRAAPKKLAKRAKTSAIDAMPNFDSLFGPE